MSRQLILRVGSLNIARDLCQRRKPNEALPYLMKALADRRNLDAILEFAFLAPTKDESVEILEEGAARGGCLFTMYHH